MPANVSNDRKPSNGNISIAPASGTNKTNSKKKYIYYNKSEQRLDEPLPAKDPAGAQALEQRMKRTGKKLCNNWHIGGHCENGNFCTFQHEPKLPPGELLALRYKARSLPCKNRYCDWFDCRKYNHLLAVSEPTSFTIEQYEYFKAYFKKS